MFPERLNSAAQLKRAAGNMGDKTDREHRLHPVTVGGVAEMGLSCADLPEYAERQLPIQFVRTQLCRHDGLVFDHAEAQPATRRAFSTGTDVEHQP